MAIKPEKLQPKRGPVVCEYCKQKYESKEAFLKDCFMHSDGLSWDYFHKCQKGLSYEELHGYK